MVRRRAESLAHMVGSEERGPSQLAVDEGRFDGLPQIRGSGYVADRVVDEDSVEGPAEPHAPHVTLHVLAFRIDRTAHGKHLRRAVDERHLETRFQMRRVVAATASKL